MNVNIIQTGSSGNCVILNNTIALDMGISYNKILPYIKDLQLVFVSHEHHDHFKKSTIKRIALERPTIRFCGGPFLANQFINSGVQVQSIDILEVSKHFNYGKFHIEPIELFHDVSNYGLKIYMDGEKVIYIVDTGYIDHIEAKNFDLYLIEANHKKEEIESIIQEKQCNGEFSYEVRASKNHLSQEQAFDWLAKNAGPKSKYVFLHQNKKFEGEF